MYRVGQDRKRRPLLAVEHVLTIFQRRVHVTETTARTGGHHVTAIVRVDQATAERAVKEVRF